MYISVTVRYCPFPHFNVNHLSGSTITFTAIDKNICDATVCKYRCTVHILDKHRGIGCLFLKA